MVEPSPSRNVATTVPGADWPAISPMEPVPEKETPVTWVLEVESSRPEGVSVVSPTLKVTVGVAPV